MQTLPTDAAVLSGELSARLASLQRVLRRQTRAAVGAPGLSVAEAEFLRLVAEQPGIRVGDAARALRLAPNTASTLARKLSAAGFVQAAADARDGRRVCLRASRAGMERLGRWRDERRRLLASALVRLSGVEREALAASLPALETVAERLEEPE
jgi:DNA-binding MarR family transcriptional regulator